MEKEEIIKLLNKSKTIIVTCSVNGVIEYVSSGVSSLFSADSEYFIGKNVFSFLPRAVRKEIVDRSQNLQHKDDSLDFVFTFNESRFLKGNFSIQVFKNKQGGFNCLLVPLSNSTYIFKEDNFRQLEVMRTTLESIDDIIFVLDQNGLFSELYNQSNTNTSNSFSSAFKIGRSLSDMGFPDDIVGLYEKNIEEIKSSRESRQINYSLKAFGGELFYMARISPRFTYNNDFDGVTVMLRDITSTVKTEQKLKKSLDYYLTVLDNFPNPIWRVNTAKRFDYFNKTWVEFTGIEAVKQYGNGWHSGIFHEDRERVVSEFAKRFADKKPFSFEYRLIHNSGNYRWVKNFCQPLYDYKERFIGYVGSCFDIDQIRSTQNLLQESESRYRTMVQEQSDLVVRWKPNLEITFVNNSFCRFFAQDKEKLLGTSWPELFPVNLKKEVKQTITDFARKKKTGFFETEIQNFENEMKAFQWLNSPVLGENDEVIEYQSVGRDITEKIQKEKENQTLLKKLNEKVKELSLLNKVSSYINDGLLHDVLLQKLANDIKKCSLHSEYTSVLIEYNEKKYRSNDFSIPGNHSLLRNGFGAFEKGYINVYRDEDLNKNEEDGTLLKSEKLLLNTVSDMLTSYFQKLETDQKLYQSELRYGELFENVMDIVFSVDKTGNVLKINSAATKILKFPSFEGLNLWNLAAPSEKAEILKLIKRQVTKKHESLTFDTKILSFEGKMIYLQIGGIIKYSDKGEPLEIFGIARDVTDQRKMEQSIMKTVITTQEKERKRFAEDLHDGIGPLLSGLKMYLQQDSLSKDLTEKQTKTIKYCKEIVDDAISQTRSIANNLTPGVLNDFGLERALISHVAKINDIGKFSIDLKILSNLEQVESDASLAIFRVVSELINNALKHAECSLITISLEIRRNILSLFYKDNGKGFEVKLAKSDGVNSKLGLNSIQNRINSLNGNVTFASKKGEGLMVKIFLPVKPNVVI
jgi:PAS domain S-box-containing protein